MTENRLLEILLMRNLKNLQEVKHQIPLVASASVHSGNHAFPSRYAYQQIVRFTWTLDSSYDLALHKTADP